MTIFGSLFKKFVIKEKVVIETEDYTIKGWLYNRTITDNRFLSNFLNQANRNFIAVTNCEIEYKKKAGQVETLDFLQLNMRFVILIKPVKD